MIKVLNYRNFQSVFYSLPLITGEVAGANDSELQVKCGEKVTFWPVVKGNFKILVGLLPGRNCIEIKVRSFTKVINLIYKPLAFKKFVRLVYITCCDSDTFQAPRDEDDSTISACDRISLAAQMLQSFTAAKLQDHNLQPKTFSLEEAEGKPICHVYQSSLHLEEALKMSDAELWDYFAVELMNSHLRVGDDSKFLGILSFTRYINDSPGPPITYKEMRSKTKAFAALGTHGLALLGSACLHSWPQSLQEVPWRFADDRKIDRMKFMDDSGFRGTFWGCYATSLGAVIHELGHIFNLGHTSDGIMARGFEDIHKHFIIDLFHCSHPFQKRHNPHFQRSVHEINCSIELNEPVTLLWQPSHPQVSPKESSALRAKMEHLAVSEGKKQNKPPWRSPDPQEINVNRSEDSNGAFWCRSSALILFYHRWFNDFSADTDVDTVQFNGNHISSCRSIRIVEFRDEENLAFHHLEYPEDTNEVDVVLEKHVLPDIIKTVKVLVEDSRGCIAEKLFPAEELYNK